MKAIIVCGSRDWTDHVRICKTLERIQPRIIIHGACRGADEIAGDWSDDTVNDVDAVPMPAQWDRDGRAAGPMRNAKMLAVLLALRDCGYEVSIVAFVLPSSRGTWDMLNKAKAAGVETHVHRGEP